VSDRALIAAEDWTKQAAALKEEGWQLRDLCGVDRSGLGRPGPGETRGAGFAEDADDRFEVVVQLLHQEKKQRRTLTIVAPGDPPTVPSVTRVWPTADFMEREAYDLLGIRFEGHPNLIRILMPDDWEGHPLRKDYGVGKVPVEFVPQPFLQIDAPGQSPEKVEAGRDVDRLGQSGAGERVWPSEDREQQ
jgi:NADH-quinone oxidoreductase subunit C